MLPTWFSEVLNFLSDIFLAMLHHHFPPLSLAFQNCPVATCGVATENSKQSIFLYRRMWTGQCCRGLWLHLFWISDPWRFYFRLSSSWFKNLWCHHNIRSSRNSWEKHTHILSGSHNEEVNPEAKKYCRYMPKESNSNWTDMNIKHLSGHLLVVRCLASSFGTK